MRRWVSSVVFLVIAIWIGYGFFAPALSRYFLGTTHNPLANSQLPGTFGDMFGTVNALFAGLSFAGVAIALILQTIQMDQQRESSDGLSAQLERFANLQKEQFEAIVKANKLLAKEFRAKYLQSLKESKLSRLVSVQNELRALHRIPHAPGDSTSESITAQEGVERTLQQEIGLINESIERLQQEYDE